MHLLPALGLLLCLRNAASRSGQFARIHQSPGACERSYSTSTVTEAPPTFPTSNPGCFPNDIPNPVPGDPSARVGTYYEYRSQGASEQIYDAMYTNTLVTSNVVYLLGTRTLAVHLTESYSYSDPEQSAPEPCRNSFIDILSRFDGVNYYTMFSSSNSTARPFISVYYYLYEAPGPRGFEIIYSCDLPNYVTGICEDPSVYVDTRIHPNSLTAKEILSIDKTIDRILKPYCFSKVDLQKVIFRDDLPKCNKPPPQDFLNLVEGFNASLTGPSS
ncbi:hypothetical protein RvY_11220 [Ramazzottius varieornatus]|uniref:Uncharacterized protein n=1 Tax=Ramazzottius varieornatus TaxID=947166 RepID=A0A1D1VFE0_RAMVA|nr:hypothetical protein RvY_11220 [Ramazzottius varieornatus]